MGVDGVVSVIESGIVEEHPAGHVTAQAHAGNAVILQQPCGVLVDGDAVPGGGILHVADGEDAVEDAPGQEGNGTPPYHQHSGKEPPVHQRQEDYRRQGQSQPTGTGVGHADGGGAQTQGDQAAQPSPPTPGVERQGSHEGEEHHQHLSKVIGVIKKGVDAPGHVLVKGHVLLGGHHLHPDIALVTAVEGSRRQTDPRQDQEGLELTVFPHSAHRHHRQQEAGQVKEEEPQGQAPAEGAHQTQGNKHRVKGEVGAKPAHLQAPPPVRAANAIEGKDGHRRQKAVNIVPCLVGRDQHPQGKQPHQGGGGPAKSGEAPEGQAPIPQTAEGPVKPLQ